MKKISVLIVEDKALIAEDISSRLVKNGMEIAGVFSTGEDVLESIRSVTPDLILMDIQLAGALDGISTVQMINKEHDIPVIYLTDHVDGHTLERAKKTFPAHYLSKPFNEPDLVRAIDIAISNWQGRSSTGKAILPDHLFIKHDQGHVKISVSDIFYLEADRAYCKIVTEAKTYIQSNNLNHVFGRLQDKDFYRVHRSYVINANKITAIEGNMIKLGKYSVEMSKSHREELVGKLRFL